MNQLLKLEPSNYNYRAPRFIPFSQITDITFQPEFNWVDADTEQERKVPGEYWIVAEQPDPIAPGEAPYKHRLYTFFEHPQPELIEHVERQFATALASCHIIDFTHLVEEAQNSLQAEREREENEARRKSNEALANGTAYEAYREYEPTTDPLTDDPANNSPEVRHR